MWGVSKRGLWSIGKMLFVGSIPQKSAMCLFETSRMFRTLVFQSIPTEEFISIPKGVDIPNGCAAGLAR